MSDDPQTAGLLLAAGGGSRMGRPKALIRTQGVDGSAGDAWAVRGARILLDSGCSPVVVVVGARATEVEQLVTAAFPGEPRLHVERAEFWSHGMAASLRRGLDALAAAASDSVDGALVTLVDIPSLRIETVRRIRDTARRGAEPDRALVQATFGGRPGHPVFLGRDHWDGLAAQLVGDAGAKAYLASHGATQIECGDLESGEDVDHA